jgi:hypothetical protein
MHRVAFLIALATALVLGGCSSSNDNAPNASTTATRSGTAAKTASGLPVGHLLYLRHVGDAESESAIYEVGAGETDGRAVIQPPAGIEVGNATASSDWCEVRSEAAHDRSAGRHRRHMGALSMPGSGFDPCDCRSRRARLAAAELASALMQRRSRDWRP